MVQFLITFSAKSCLFFLNKEESQRVGRGSKIQTSRAESKMLNSFLSLPVFHRTAPEFAIQKRYLSFC